MQIYDLTLRFDNEAHSLTAQNGIPAEDVGRILIDLTHALGSGHEIVLSEIRGNCYALNISTSHLMTHEILKVIHRKISENDFVCLNTEQRKYASTLKVVFNKEKVHLDVYTPNKEEYFFKVREIVMPEKPKFYYELGSIYGKITAIGGKSLEGKTSIKINDGGGDIEITNIQEQKLIAHYKKSKLLLTVKKKINFEDGSLVSMILEDFEVVSESDFFKGIKELSEQYPKGLFSSESGEDLLFKLRHETH
jgi:hypothetical protein